MLCLLAMKWNVVCLFVCIFVFCNFAKLHFVTLMEITNPALIFCIQGKQETSTLDSILASIIWTNVVGLSWRLLVIHCRCSIICLGKNWCRGKKNQDWFVMDETMWKSTPIYYTFVFQDDYSCLVPGGKICLVLCWTQSKPVGCSNSHGMNSKFLGAKAMKIAKE